MQTHLKPHATLGLPAMATVHMSPNSVIQRAPSAGHCTCQLLQDILCTAASRKSEVAAQVLAVAVERGAQGLVIGIPVQPGGRLTDPDSDSPVVSAPLLDVAGFSICLGVYYCYKQSISW